MTGFTPERIETAMQRFRDLLSGARREAVVTVHHSPTYRQQTDLERMVAEACACIRADGASGEPDVVPTFWPDFGTISTARLWGGTEKEAHDGGGVYIEPVAHAYADLERVLPRAAPFETSDFQKAVDLWRQVCTRLETDQVFLRTPDFQGPMNTLALVLDQTELMCALYEAPDLIDWALDQVTDVLIDRFGRLRETVGKERVVGNIWPYVVLPDGQGVSVTQDYMPLLGPEMYARFELPRLKRIADAFGGVWIHCCGEYARHFDALSRADFTILGLEIHHPYTPLEQAWDAFGDRVVYLPYVAQKELSHFDGIEAFVESLADKPCGRARYWLVAGHEGSDVPRLKRAAARLG